MDRRQGSGGQHRPLDALLAALLDETPQAREVAELRLVDGRLGADRQRRPDLADDHADLARRHLDPRVLLHPVQHPELPAQTGHQQVRLVAGLALEGDEVVLGQFLEREPFDDQPDLGRPDHSDRRQNDEHQQERRQAPPPPGTVPCLSPHADARLTRRGLRGGSPTHRCRVCTWRPAAGRTRRANPAIAGCRASGHGHSQLLCQMSGRVQYNRSRSLEVGASLDAAAEMPYHCSFLPRGNTLSGAVFRGAIAMASTLAAESNPVRVSG